MQQPIGIFDSGVGGTSIWKEIHSLLPFEDTCYLADSANAPYGNKGRKEILRLSIKNTELLLEMGCKIIVVACNTATTNAISELRQRYNVPFIGIEPAIKPAALQTTTKNIGILATKGTLNSSLFHATSQTFASDLNVVEVIGEGLVPLIEKGALESPELLQLLEEYVAPMLAADIDHLVLGCSHYPYLIPLLKTMLPEHVQIIDSGEAVARQTKTILIEKNLLSSKTNSSSHSFFSNKNTHILEHLLANYKEVATFQRKEF